MNGVTPGFARSVNHASSIQEGSKEHRLLYWKITGEIHASHDLLKRLRAGSYSYSDTYPIRLKNHFKLTPEVLMEFILGVIVFVLDVWAVIQILRSSASGLAKLLWVLLILVLPLLGFIIWLVGGPKPAKIGAS
jgi:Phospholipase_D-nuclease N-terminal